MRGFDTSLASKCVGLSPTATAATNLVIRAKRERIIAE
jgi:hypothetical protein